MSTPAPTTRVPPISYRVYRAFVVLVFVLALVVVGLGATGSGPARALRGPTDQAVTWVKHHMGVDEELDKPVKQKKKGKRKNNKRKKRGR